MENNALSVQDTTPDENIYGIADEPETAQTVSGEPTEQSEVEPYEADSFLEVTFNHTKRNLKRDEAVKYAQMGLNHERLTPVFEKLGLLASISGKSREEYLESQIRQSEEELKRSIEEKYGEDSEVSKEMLAFALSKRGLDYENFLKEELSANEKEAKAISEGLRELKTEFPELAEAHFATLPKEVQNNILGGERPLLAYLLYQHNQNKLVAEQMQREQSANEKSAGSLATAETAASRDEFLEGLFGR